jgi:hypothetical protein
MPSNARLELALLNRTCGDCHACCTEQAVRELGKPYRTRCQHLGQGCSIYAQRPQSCADYHCGWITVPEILDDADRPDRAGFILDVEEDDQGRWLQLFLLRELAPEALRNAFLKAFQLFSCCETPCQGVRVYRAGQSIAQAFPTQAPYPPDAGTGHRNFETSNGVFFIQISEEEARQSQATQTAVFSTQALRS